MYRAPTGPAVLKNVSRLFSMESRVAASALVSIASGILQYALKSDIARSHPRGAAASGDISLIPTCRSSLAPLGVTRCNAQPAMSGAKVHSIRGRYDTCSCAGTLPCLAGDSYVSPRVTAATTTKIPIPANAHRVRRRSVRLRLSSQVDLCESAGP
jgi:hypothetical protein